MLKREKEWFWECLNSFAIDAKALGSKGCGRDPRLAETRAPRPRGVCDSRGCNLPSRCFPSLFPKKSLFNKKDQERSKNSLRKSNSWRESHLFFESVTSQARRAIADLTGTVIQGRRALGNEDLSKKDCSEGRSSWGRIGRAKRVRAEESSWGIWLTASVGRTSKQLSKSIYLYVSYSYVIYIF